MNYHRINNKLILISFVTIIFILAGCSKKQDQITQSETAIQPETEFETDNQSGAGIQSETDTQAETEQETDTKSRTVIQSEADTDDTQAETVIQSESSDKQSAVQAYSKYLGRWSNSDDTCSMNIISLDNESIHFSFEVGSETRTAEVEEVVGIVEGNTIQFDFTDSWNNKGQGTLILNESNIQLSSNITVPDPTANFSASIDTELSRKSAGDNNEYIFYDSNIRYLTEDEIRALSKSEMKLARNEIYARHGRLFKDVDLQNYFNSQQWYVGSVDADIFDSNQDLLFNEFEKANIALIKKIEQD